MTPNYRVPSPRLIGEQDNLLPVVCRRKKRRGIIVVRILADRIVALETHANIFPAHFLHYIQVHQVGDASRSHDGVQTAGKSVA